MIPLRTNNTNLMPRFGSKSYKRRIALLRIYIEFFGLERKYPYTQVLRPVNLISDGMSLIVINHFCAARSQQFVLHIAYCND